MTPTIPAGIGVMYHYVYPNDATIPSGIRPARASVFAAQLDWLTERFEVLDDERLSAVLAGSYEPRRPWCVLTFDDGTKDHSAVAAPMLIERGLVGFFFVLTGPWRDRRLPTTHRVHVLLSTVPSDELWRALRDLSEELGDNDLGDEDVARTTYRYESEIERIRVKYALNFALPTKTADLVTEVLFDRLLGDEEAIVDDWFMSVADVQAMATAGMVIGPHGRLHTALGRLDGDALRDELHQAHFALREAVQSDPHWYAYPFGGSDAQDGVLDRADAILTTLGYHGVFVRTPAPQPIHGAAGQPLPRLDRFDCIELPPWSSTPSWSSGRPLC